MQTVKIIYEDRRTVGMLRADCEHAIFLMSTTSWFMTLKRVLKYMTTSSETESIVNRIPKIIFIFFIFFHHCLVFFRSFSTI